MTKKDLAHLFIKEVNDLDKNKAVSSFSMVPTQQKAFDIAKSIPKDFEDDLVTDFYACLIRKGGVFTNLKFVKESHYHLLIDAFRQMISHLGTEKAGLLHQEEMFFLFNSIEENFEVVSLDDFKTFLQVIIQSKKYTNIPGIASHQKSFSVYATDPLIIERSIQTIKNILQTFDTIETWRSFLFYSLVSIILFDDSEKSIDLIKYISSEKLELQKKRTYIYCLNQIIQAHKNESHIQPIIQTMLAEYPQEWLNEYLYEG